jgi:signal peptidase I
MIKIKKVWKFIPFLIFFFILFDFKLVVINGNSMQPTLPNGSYAIVDKYLFKLFEIRKNDILLFKKENEEIVKKIAGFPNEKILIENKEYELGPDEVFLLGENLPESIDSREYGALPTKSIQGKIVISY